jgi:hypothetical protein
MIEFGAILFTTGVNLVGNLLFKWISEGRSAVKTSTIERDIAAQAAIEAERRRLRPDDLVRASQEALKEIVERTPQLSFAKSGLHSSSLRLAFDPKDPGSSKHLLLSLRERIEQIDHDAQKAVQQRGVDLPPGAVLVPPERNARADRDPTGHPAVPRQGGDARRMLDNLKTRIERIETDRE